jgi:hypothetical protein
VPGKAQGERPGGGELEQCGNDAEDAQDVDGVENKDCREGGARRRAGTGMGEEFQLPSGDGFNARARRRFRVLSLYSRFFCFQGDVWVVREEASLASHVHKAGNRL